MLEGSNLEEKHEKSGRSGWGRVEREKKRFNKLSLFRRYRKETSTFIVRG